MADRVSARRGTANNFFLAVHAAVVTAVAALIPKGDEPGALPLDSTLVAAAGIALTAAWWLRPQHGQVQGDRRRAAH